MTAAVLAAVLAGCYAVPPRPPPEGARVDWPQGWPPAAVYVSDPLHPANRWRQRALRIEGAMGPVDRAEIVALLDALAREGLPSGAPPEARARLRADLEAALARLRASGAGESPARKRGLEAPATRLDDAYERAIAALGRAEPPPAPTTGPGRSDPPSR